MGVSDQSRAARTVKPPLYRRAWVLVVAGVVVLGALGALLGDDDAQPDVSTRVAVAPDVVGMALDEATAHLERHGFVAEAADAVEDRAIVVRVNWVVVSQEQDGETVRLLVNKSREPREESSERDDAADSGMGDEDRVARIEARVLAMYEVDSLTDVLLDDPTEWAGYVAGFRIEGARLYVTLQISGDDDFDKQLAEHAANALSVIGDDLTDGLRWVVIENGAAVVVAQSEVP